MHELRLFMDENWEIFDSLQKKHLTTILEADLFEQSSCVHQYPEQLCWEQAYPCMSGEESDIVGKGPQFERNFAGQEAVWLSEEVGRTQRWSLKKVWVFEAFRTIGKVRKEVPLFSSSVSLNDEFLFGEKNLHSPSFWSFQLEQNFNELLKPAVRRQQVLQKNTQLKDYQLCDPFAQESLYDKPEVLLIWVEDDTLRKVLMPGN